MTGELSKTISTIAIWAGTSAAIIFGICRTDVSLFGLLGVLVVMTGATFASIAIWAPAVLLGMQDKSEPIRGFEVVSGTSSHGSTPTDQTSSSGR